MREFVKQVADSLRHDTTWTEDKHWAINEKLGVKVWIANGFWFVHLQWYPEDRRAFGVDIYLSLLEKLWLWPAVHKQRRLSKYSGEEAVTATIIARRLGQGEKK